jgi:hypothetical protein
MAHIASQRPRKIDNLQEYVRNRGYHLEAGFIDGKVHFRGKVFEKQEFDEMFPVELKYSVINEPKLDSRHIR